jgi:hypothetical protein
MTKRVRLPTPTNLGRASDAPTLFVVGTEAERTIDYVEKWLEEMRH